MLQPFHQELEFLQIDLLAGSAEVFVEQLVELGLQLQTAQPLELEFGFGAAEFGFQRDDPKRGVERSLWDSFDSVSIETNQLL